MTSSCIHSRYWRYFSSDLASSAHPDMAWSGYSRIIPGELNMFARAHSWQRLVKKVRRCILVTQSDLRCPSVYFSSAPIEGHKYTHVPVAIFVQYVKYTKAIQIRYDNTHSCSKFLVIWEKWWAPSYWASLRRIQHLPGQRSRYLHGTCVDGRVSHMKTCGDTGSETHTRTNLYHYSLIYQSINGKYPKET